MTLLVQITDTHILPSGDMLYGNTDTAAHLAESIRQINAMRPKPGVVLITGDLVEKPDRACYEYFIDIIGELEMPTYVIPGNHDDPYVMREAFAGTSHFPALDDTFQFVIEGFPFRILALNSHCEGTELPEFDHRRLSWLQYQLSRSDELVLVALHHYIDGEFLSGSNSWPANVEEKRIDKESCLSWDELKKSMMGTRYQAGD